MTNTEFFNKEEQANRDKWLQADGWHQEVLKNNANSWRETSFKDTWADWQSADGENDNIPVSAPYILQIVNACSGGAIANVDLGNAYLNRTASSTNFGLNGNITVSSTVTDVSYLEILASTEKEPFTVAQTMVISTSAGQLEQTIQVNHKNPSGKSDSFVISSTASPFQNLTDRVIDKTEYVWDGFTRFRFNRINAGATVTVRLYLKNRFSAYDLISGKPQVQKFIQPNLIGV